MLIQNLLVSLVCLRLNHIFHSLTTPLGFQKLILLYKRWWSHSHTQTASPFSKRDKETHLTIQSISRLSVRSSHADSASHISLRTAQTSESNLSAKTVIHAGGNNQSLATTLFYSFLSRFALGTTSLDQHTLMDSSIRSPAGRQADTRVFWSGTLTGSPPQRLTAFSSTLSFEIWQTIRWPLRNKNLMMGNDPFASQRVD